ncbi:VWA domain-containing protein [uncultured Pelagimonas sp.]|uniref:VWA domain-containing protein n=1 Tax=uncultured Pelagimonas sp. TaxID=1618102 RepID=UPI0026318691|nr:VWA domain-containing protein [uncultured Pelagimonas sp.]
MMSLAHPWLLLLLVAPWFIWKFSKPHKERVSAVRVPFFRDITAAVGAEAQQGAVVLRRGKFQMAVALAVWALIVIALAKPERLGEPVVVEKSARDIVLALDISGSMDERDFMGKDGELQQRLDVVKTVLKDFIAERDGDRMALIVFGSKAFVQAPFTEDLQSLTGFLDQTVVGMAGPDTAVGDAIGLAVRTFEASDVEERLIILLSDGADTSSRMTPINAAAIAAERGITIQTIGVGDPESSGSDRLDLGALEDIAKRTGGTFFVASDTDALAQTYARIDEMTPRIVEEASFRPSENLVWMVAALGSIIGVVGLGIMILMKRRQTT